MLGEKEINEFIGLFSDKVEALALRGDKTSIDLIHNHKLLNDSPKDEKLKSKVMASIKQWSVENAPGIQNANTSE